MRDILIIGDRPGPRTDPTRPLYPHTTTGAAARLRDIMGLTDSQYLETQRINARHDGTKLLTLVEARTRLQSIISGLNEGSLIVLLGGEALRCVPEAAGLEWGSLVILEGKTLVAVPHTSGINRFWNDEAQATRIRKTLRDLVASR